VGRTVVVVEVRDPDRGAKPALMGLARSAHHVSPIGGCAKASYYRLSGVDNAFNYEQLINAWHAISNLQATAIVNWSYAGFQQLAEPHNCSINCGFACSWI
jgi:hypothetical protein